MHHNPIHIKDQLVGISGPTRVIGNQGGRKLIFATNINLQHCDVYCNHSNICRLLTGAVLNVSILKWC